MSLFKYTVKFVLQQTANSSKITPLRCFVRYNNQRAVFASGEALEPRYWNATAQAPRQVASFPDAGRVAKSLKSITACIATAFDHLTDLHKTYPDPDVLRDLILRVINNGGVIPGHESKTTDLFVYIEQLINDTESGKRVKQKGERYAPGTIKHYNSAYGVLKRFASYKNKSSLKFNDINLDFYFELREYAYQVEKLTDNYFGTVIKFLKTCMNESRADMLHTNDQHNGKRFVKVSVDVENVYLTRDQLEQLHKHDFGKDHRLDRARDLFLVGCWTGLRFSDFTNIKSKNISGDFIEIKTQKTGEVVAIPIHDTLRSIMVKYAGKTNNSLPAAISNAKLNEYIKDAAKAAGLDNIVHVEKSKAGKGYSVGKPLHELITTHTARRTFASNMFKMGVPTFAIMAVTGHKTEKAFLKYIKVSPKEKAELMRAIWSRESLKVVEA